MLRRKSKSQPRGAPNIAETANVFSYRASRLRVAQNEGRHTSETETADKRRRWWHYIPSYLAAIVIFFSLIYATTLSTYPKIILFNDNSSVSLLRNSQVYQQALENLLHSSILNRSKFTIDTNNLTSKLEQQFPELTQVIINIPLTSRQLVAELASSNPALLLVTGSKSYAIDQQGRALLPLDEITIQRQLLLPSVVDQSGLLITPGKTALPQDTVTFITEVVGQLIYLAITK